MIIDFESKNMAWRFYFSIDWRSFYIAIVLAGIDISFHILSVRDIVYPNSASAIHSSAVNPE